MRVGFRPRRVVTVVRLTWAPAGVDGVRVARAKKKHGSTTLARSPAAGSREPPLIVASIWPPAAGIATVAAVTQVPVVPSLSSGATCSTAVTAAAAPGWENSRVKVSVVSSGTLRRTISALTRVRSNGSVAL